MTAQTIEIRPQSGPQEQWLANPADVAFFGGAAGGGKSYALLLEPLRHCNNPDFGAVIFRRTYPQVTNEGGLWNTSEKIYPLVGASGSESKLEWDFPGGGTVKFAHMQHERNRLDWQGSQIPFIGFDELSHFTRKQFFYMFSRNRSATAGIRPYIRATMNPVPDDDPTGGWLHEFVEWYLDDDGYAALDRSGVVRWFTVVHDVLEWADSYAELKRRFPDNEPRSFTFVKSSVYDNPILMMEDPSYLSSLQALDYVEQQQLLGDKEKGGNWYVRPAAGKVFNRAWFEIVGAPPAKGETVRFWDLAASEKKFAKDDPDYTAGILMRRAGDTYYVLDCVEEQLAPAETDTLIHNVATQDGATVAVRWEMEGGASGKRDSRTLASLLAGYDARGVRPQGDKLVRAKGLSAQAYAGNVKLVRGPWNERWLRHMHGQPELAHDDIMDASSGAFNHLAKPPANNNVPASGGKRTFR